MSDKLMFENILLIIKSNLEVYTHGTIESSNTAVRNAIKYGLDTSLNLQNEIYTKMSEEGWYPIQNIDAKEISKTYKKICKK